MRLLFVGTNPGGGGTESHIISLARALAEAGHDVAAAVRPDDFIHRGLALDPRIRLFAAEFRSRRDVRAVRDLVSLARAVRPDWIIGSFKKEYWGLAIAAKSAGIPLVLFSHLDQRVRPVLVHRLTRLVRVVIVPSEYSRQRAIERGLPPSHVVALPNPIDVDRFRRDAELRMRIRASIGVAADDVLLGYVGRFERPKGVDTLARAASAVMSMHARLHMLWVGHGVSEATLRDAIDRDGVATRHHWMPWLEDVLPAYNAMDLLALPSQGSETFGRVLVEAQACGLPVLGARNGGIPEALAEGTTGQLVAPGDVSSWTRAIAQLAGDDALRRRFASAARAFAERFDAHKIAEEFEQVLAAYSPRRRAPTHPRTRPVTRARKVAAD
jgi:glycosyltransferase involved in cell wall biosynthesis